MKRINKVAMCLHCSYGELEVDDVIDTYNVSGDTADISELIVGHCPYCNRSYQWKNVFTFSHYEDLVETEDEDWDGEED